MKAFMDADFMLYNETAKHLFHEYAESLPIIDYHCHISPQEIYEDRRYNNIAEIWLGGKQPNGGYFVSLDVMDGCAKRVVALCRDAGVTMTSWTLLGSTKRSSSISPSNSLNTWS